MAKACAGRFERVLCSHRFFFKFSCVQAGFGRDSTSLYTVYVSNFDLDLNCHAFFFCYFNNRFYNLFLILIIFYFFCRGLVLQDLTFVHIGNSNLLSDGMINFSKRWQQYNIVENMKRFKKW